MEAQDYARLNKKADVPSLPVDVGAAPSGGRGLPGEELPQPILEPARHTTLYEIPDHASEGAMKRVNRGDGVIGTMLDHALRYAREGIAIFPVSAHKKPVTSHGFHDASTDEAQVREWYEDRGDRGIATPTGKAAGRVILDVDVRPDEQLDGHVALESLIRENGPIPRTPTVRSSRGGIHLHLDPRGAEVPSRTGHVGEALDQKAEGGYVVLPPSPHYLGGRYVWTVSPDEKLAPIPEWLLDRMLAVPSRKDIPWTGSIPSGQRNRALFPLGCSLRARGFDDSAILAQLRIENEARCVPPLADDEVVEIARSVTRYPKDLRYTDLENAKRFVCEFGSDVRYLHDRRKWFIWTAQRWVEDRDAEIRRKAKASIEALHVEALRLSDDKERKALRQHALKSESATRLREMIELAESDENVATISDHFDTDPWLLNVENGTIDLRTCELHPHRREDLLTKSVNAPYDPAATCPRFLEFLDRIMDGKSALIDFLQRAVGYSLTGSTQEQVFFILYGSGANGKSTFVGAIKDLLGDYALTCEPETLMVKAHGGASNDVARLRGARFVASVECEENRRLAEARIKQITGGDTVAARFLYAEHFEFVPEFKLFLATNHKPEIRGGDDAIWRRVRLIPFRVQIPEAERDSDLPDVLRSEATGILAWAVEGCRLWQADGLKSPKAVLTATAEYRQEEDRVAAFIAECCTTGPSYREGAQQLYNAYREWAEQNGEDPITLTSFGRRLEDRGFFKKSTSTGRLRLGLALRTGGLFAEDGICTKRVEGVEGLMRFSQTSPKKSLHAGVMGNGSRPSIPSTTVLRPRNQHRDNKDGRKEAKFK